MKQKSTSQSAFFNLRVLIGLFVVLAGVFLALVSFGTFSAHAQQGPRFIINSTNPLVPNGFDCSQIRALGIDKQDNMRAGAIMIACGESEGGSATTFAELMQQILPAPLTFGGTDVDLINNPSPETGTHITQSETFSFTNPDDPNTIVVEYNDSRGVFSSPINITGASVSTDGGATFTRLTKSTGQSPFANTLGDPVVLFNKPIGTWFAYALDPACGGQGIGGYKSTNPSDPNSWTTAPCVHSGSFDDRESGWSDTNSSSPFFGHMYVSYNDFNIGGGALFVRTSTDNGTTWTPHQLTSSFLRDVQITGDLATGVVYLAAMNEEGGGLTTRANVFYRSTDGGTTWTNTFNGSQFPGPGVVACSGNTYFACMFTDNGGYWRHMGWGEPAALNGVVHYVYASRNTSNGDPGNVFYIRSTDMGMTFSAPLQLNTDTTTRPQWQPNISVSASGTVFAMWYDARGSTSCQKGNPAVPCYQMFGRKSTDNGVTWTTDMAFSDVISPLPGQPDPGIISFYAGDYDYASALTGFHNSAWNDGRVPVSGQSQQDAFFDKEAAGAAGIPCSDLVSFNVRCITGDKLQAKLTLTNTSHSGQTVTITVDSTPHIVTISGSTAKLQIISTPGTHTVTLTNPAGCFPARMPSCP
jgi:hypothetical protein